MQHLIPTQYQIFKSSGLPESIRRAMSDDN